MRKYLKVILFLTIFASVFGVVFAVNNAIKHPLFSLSFNSDNAILGLQDSANRFQLNTQSSDMNWYWPNKPFPNNYMAGEIKVEMKPFHDFWWFTCWDYVEWRLPSWKNRNQDTLNKDF